MTMTTVKLRVYAYASNLSEVLDVPAHIVGDIAIHRPASYAGGREPLRLSDIGWSVSHIPSGAPIDNARPRNLRHPGNLRSLKQWAARWQELAPEAFATLRASNSAIKADPALGRTLLDASAQADPTVTP